MKTYHILNLGAGVQSTALYLMACEGGLPIGHAIFADTQDEPAAVYRHLDWLQSLSGPPILIRSKGRLSDILRHGTGPTGRYVSIPAFAAEDHATRPRFCAGVREGMMRRQCTKEYKIEVIEKCIRYEVVGLRPRQRMPADVRVCQYFGISKDEAIRAEKVRESYEKHKWAAPVFPLLDMGMSRIDCVLYLRDRVPRTARTRAGSPCASMTRSPGTGPWRSMPRSGRKGRAATRA